MRANRRPVSGVVLLDKPEHMSSTTAMARVRWLFQAQKAGHTGTLDPFATGLLPIALGEAAKYARFLLDAPKAYRATLKLGERTPTGDTESQACEVRPVNVDVDSVQRVLAEKLGPQRQVPPMFSAVKQDGVALYKLARQGLEVERPGRDIVVSSLVMVSLEGPLLVLDAQVSKGTYLRVLAEDVGEALGCGAHLVALRRTATAGLLLENAVTLEQLEALELPARDEHLAPVDTLCASLPAVTLDSANSEAFTHGRIVRVASATPGEVRVYGHAGKFMGVATCVPGEGDTFGLTPVRLMSGTSD